MAFLQRLGQLRSPVSTYSNLPLTGNVQGDLRIALDTGDAYTWMNESSSGLITDWNKVTVSSYSELIGAPYSTALDIDNAVKVVTGLSINIALLAFTTLTGYWSSLAKMFDGIINQFTAEDSGLEVEDCENQTYVNIQENVNGGFYLPNKGDLDIYTRMLIHGDGVQGSTSFVDLLRQPLTSSNAIVDLNVKKFGTGSIKFNGTNSSLAISDASGIIMGKYMKSEFYAEPMCLDFWLYSLASGLQPILANIAYDDGYGKTYDAGEYFSIQRLANGHIYANIIVTTNMGMTDTLVEVESASTVSDNTWHHIAIQKVDGYLQIWIDGSLDATSVAHVESENSGCQAVIKFGQLDTAFLNGHLDEIRLSNTERYTTTFTPMTKAYNTATTPAPTPEIVDESSYEHVIDVYGNARMSGTNPLLGNSSLYLDGVDSYLSTVDVIGWQLSESLMGGIDSSTKLLLHLNNALTDSEITPKTVTNTNVTFSDSIKKFGTHSASFNGTNAYLSVPDSDDFYFGSEDFTIDCWVYFNNVSTEQGIIGQGTYPAYRNYLRIYSGNLYWYNDGESGYSNVETSGLGLVINTWYHIACVRNGTSFKIYVNGVEKGSTTKTTVLRNCAGNFWIGQDPTSSKLNGYIDEFRVSKGIARWTAPFTPETEEYHISYEDYTVDLWVCPLDITDLETYIIGVDDSWTLTLDGTSNKYIKYQVIDGASIIAPISLAINTWNHIAIVQYQGVLKLYINGVVGASVSGSAIVNTETILSVGANSIGEHLFHGFMEEIRISKGVARWTAPFTPPIEEYSSDDDTMLLLPLNTQTVPNMVLQSVGYVSNYVPTSARVVIFEEDIDTMEPNIDLDIMISRDGGTTFSPCLIAKDQEFGDGTLNLFTGSVDLDTQPNGELMVWKLTTHNNKDCRIRGVSLNWR
jgi:hypothetical protein